MGITFAIIAALTLVSGVAAMSLRNLVHCALSLGITFAGLAAMFLNQLGNAAGDISRSRLEHAAGRLRALSPRSTLERGYAIVRTEREIVRTVEQVEKGAELEVEVADGRFGACAQ